jgi:thiol-disulfide isomerase/thioredoxin
MLSISLGPIALPVQPLLLLLAVWGASSIASRWVAARVGRRVDAPESAAAAGRAVLAAAAIGLLAARLAHLGLNSDLYLAAPLSALDIRDGGWHGWAGACAGLAWLAVRARRAPALRGALAAATLAGGAFWTAATWLAGAGDAATMPALTFSRLDNGAPVDLRSAAAGRPVVVNLWASWCGPCREEMPTLGAAQRRHGEIGFLFVNQGESAAAVHTYLATLGLPLHEVLIDAPSALGPAVGSRGLPTTLFYDTRGRLISSHFGVLNAPALESRLRELRAAR